MQFSEWEPVYSEILADMGYRREDDVISVRVLKMVTVNSDLIDPDELSKIIGREVTVFGNSKGLEKCIEKVRPVGTLIASGSTVGRLAKMGITPDIVVTDLDGDMGPQIDASSKGVITLIHAHGDNTASILMYASRFKGPVIMTTQAAPELTVFNFGGFTDGDRAVCLARHFGASSILLEGFDFENPNYKQGGDAAAKKKKLKWARRIIYDMNPPRVKIRNPDPLF